MPGGEATLTYSLRTLRGDLSGGVTSAVVALPVSLAFGVVSGLGAEAGLYGAIAVGFFASVFGGNRYQISGPTPSMTVAIAVVVSTHASSVGDALVMVVLAGLLQIALGAMGAGRFVLYTPHVVVSGFMSGIGIVIILIQLLPLLGAPSSPDGPAGTLRALPSALANVNGAVVALGVAALAVNVLWPRRLAKFLPGPLVALVVGTAAGMLWVAEAPVIGAIPTGLPGIAVSMPSTALLLDILQPAVILALLGSVDSLLTSLVADSLTGTQHDPNRELVGQGIGNAVSGVFGGLAGAGATLGTVVNIRAGARTRVSGAIRAIVLLGVLLGLGRYLEPIPHAVLAGIMIKVGWDIIDRPLLARIHRIRRDHLFVMALTLGLTVFVDLVTAVGIGLIAAGMAHARKLEDLELDNVLSVPLLDREFLAGDGEARAMDRFSARTGLVRLRGTFTVASAHKLVGAIGEDIQEHEVVIFDFSETAYVDDSAAMLIGQLLRVAADKDTGVVVRGLSGAVSATLDTLGVLAGVPEHHIVDSMEEAREAALQLLGLG